MGNRATWRDSYWKSLDKETAKRLRTRCPRCGCGETYYNREYQSWRCGRCEHSFIVQGLGEKTPWWKRLIPFLAD